MKNLNKIWIFLAILVVGIVLFYNLYYSPASISVGNPRPTTFRDTPYTVAMDTLAPRCGMYTDHYFTNLETMTISGTLWTDSLEGRLGQVKISLYQVGIEDPIDSCTVSEENRGTELSHTFVSLAPNASYYLRVDNRNEKSLFVTRNVSFDLNIQ